MKPDSNEPAAIVFFDGLCNFCDHTVSTLVQLDTRGLLRYSPLQGETFGARLAGRTDIAGINSIILLDLTGRNESIHTHSDAVIRILQIVGGPWAFAALFLWFLPLPLRNWGYRNFAAIRYKVFGKKETCRLATPAERDLFLP